MNLIKHETQNRRATVLSIPNPLIFHYMLQLTSFIDFHLYIEFMLTFNFYGGPLILLQARNI